ncbi:MAG: cobaltochelatase subunit CobN, partial [Chloroflexi bacterium]|nr:cobaltochelatase subunit CobN [Chloroflexota bacterium]
MATASQRSRARNLVVRADGKTVNVVRKQGHLFVCATGCCCGHAERNFPPVPSDLYHNEWERRRLRNRVHLTIGGCLGPCTLFNVAMLLFDHRSLWFHSLNSEGLVLALYDYIDSMLAAGRYMPPPPALAGRVFTSFVWDDEHQQHIPHVDLPISPNLGSILVITQADTDLLTFSQVRSNLPEGFPEIQVFNPSHLQAEDDIDLFLNEALHTAEIILLRLIGGRASFAYGFDRILDWVKRTGTWLVCLPGTDALDPELTAASTSGVPVAHETFAYLQYGGADNYANCLKFLADHLLATGFGFDPPVEHPRCGYYYPGLSHPNLSAIQALHNPDWPTAGILFYRSHLLSGNTNFIDALVAACQQVELNALPIFAYSLKDRTPSPSSQQDNGTRSSVLPDALRLVCDRDRLLVEALINTTSFALGAVSSELSASGSDWTAGALIALDIPILQAITASSTRPEWEASTRGLSPLDAAMNIAIPEFDGRIITVPISFKEHLGATSRNGGADLAVRYAPDHERSVRVAALARRFIILRRKRNHEKHIAFVLTNSTAKASRIGNAVGLDAPASLIVLLRAMQEAGYSIENIPNSGDELIHALINRCSYDQELLTDWQLNHAAAHVSTATHARWHSELPTELQNGMDKRWGAPPGTAYVHDGQIALAGMELGNVFIALQPPRGYGLDPNLIYHMPDLAPPHHYHTLYRWLRDPNGWAADAIIHLGKHGTLEWLPGKGLGPSLQCYPDAFLADLPLIYPFIINDPGEGTQAKRRTHATIVDHMTPPLTTAGAYGELAELAQLVDEYYQVEQLDPTKLPLLQRQIWDLLQQAHLDDDLKVLMTKSHDGHTHAWDEAFTEDGTPVAISELRGKDFAHLLEDIDGYLCELTGLQIRDGLHVLGHVPEGEELVELLFNLVRLPNLEVPSLREVVARLLGFQISALLQ